MRLIPDFHHRRLAGPVLLVGLLASVFLPAEAPAGYSRLWADEFEGPGLDTKAWTFRSGKAGEGLALPENVFVSNGSLVIRLRKEADGAPASGGGAISLRTFSSGWFETAVWLDTTPGWHESFWTTWTTNIGLREEGKRSLGGLELDIFEHYGSHDAHAFTYGAIEWWPVKGDLARAYPVVADDLRSAAQVFAMEVLEGAVAFYRNGALLSVHPLVLSNYNPFHLWLGCIPKSGPRLSGGVVRYDYVRVSSLDPSRRMERLALLRSNELLGAGPAPKAASLWLEAEDLPRLGAWTVERKDGAVLLRGQTTRREDRPRSDLEAGGRIALPEAGPWHLWVRSYDQTKETGKRRFRLRLGAALSKTVFGTHGKNGLAWEDGGVFELGAGSLDLVLEDEGQYYGRCDRILLTRDPAFVPDGTGLPANTNAQP
ncbi:MAG: glycoside hydrolase family 16 protein [Spirochaetes bacterium]|nr:glycoside hydrolase family 16 protein [Spirochaetota bacterium]